MNSTTVVLAALIGIPLAPVIGFGLRRYDRWRAARKLRKETET